MVKFQGHSGVEKMKPQVGLFLVSFLVVIMTMIFVIVVLFLRIIINAFSTFTQTLMLAFFCLLCFFNF